jgi:hypothetical protein
MRQIRKDEEGEGPEPREHFALMEQILRIKLRFRVNQKKVPMEQLIKL